MLLILANSDGLVDMQISAKLIETGVGHDSALPV